jgi:ActR/RegA family two-component response regulator
MTDQGRILIADDEETFLNSMADLLRQRGYQCDCAPDAIVAAELLRSADYDLLIADIKMQGNFELEFIRALPQIAEGMPVILVTGYPSLRSAIESIQLPVAAYLVKPFEFEELLVQVQISVKNYQFCQAVRDNRKRLVSWSEDLKGIEEEQNIMPRGGFPSPIDDFLTLTFQNIAGALSDLKHLTESFSTGSSSQQEVCHLLNCPRLNTLNKTLVETIDILEKTKSAFKSKELGILRRNLEELVKDLR